MNKSNQKITFKGSPLKVTGREIHEGDALPSFKLVGQDMQDLDSGVYAGKPLILSVIPSIDTPVCAIQTKRFNEEALKLSNDVRVLTVSVDLPFAFKRFCAAEGLARVETASDFKYRSFGESFGTFIQDMGLLARAIFVVNRQGKVTHVEYVPDISSEPDYNSAIAAVKATI